MMTMMRMPIAQRNQDWGLAAVPSHPHHMLPGGFKAYCEHLHWVYVYETPPGPQVEGVELCHGSHDMRA